MATETPFQKTRKLEAALWEDFEPNKKDLGLIGEYFDPTRNACISGEQRNDATKRSLKIINSVANECLDTYEAGMLAGNASPSQLWMKVTTRNRKLAQADENKTFLQDLTDGLFEDCANSNAYPSLGLGWRDQGLYGTEAMLVIQDTEDPVRCYVFSIGTYAIGQDNRGAPNTFSHRFQMTAAQMRAQFGEMALSQEVRDALKNKPEQKFDVCHVIQPNPDYHENASVARFRKFHECYYEKNAPEGKDEKYLKESGYGSFPVVVSRWKSAGLHTAWGVGIGIKLLSDCMQLQLTTKDEANSIEFKNNPAMKGPGSLANAWVKRRPGQFTAVDVQAGQQQLEPLFDNDLDIGAVELVIARLEQRLRSGFFTDLFKQFTGPVDRLPKTAYLAQKMFLEKVANLLPVMEQQNREFLAPFIERLIQIRIETGRLLPFGSVVPPGVDALVVPEGLDGKALTFEFVSPFAEAQRAARTGSMETFLAFWTQLAAQFPAAASMVANKIDFYAAIDESADGYSMPPKMLRSADEVAELDEAQAEAMEAQRTAQNVPGAAGAVKALGETQLGTDSALDAALAGAA